MSQNIDFNSLTDQQISQLVESASAVLSTRKEIARIKEEVAAKTSEVLQLIDQLKHLTGFDEMQLWLAGLPEFRNPVVVEDPETGTDTAPGTNSIPEFVQPVDATGVYQLGAKVFFGGAVYESVIPDNAWSPDDYPQGWKRVG